MPQKSFLEDENENVDYEQLSSSQRQNISLMTPKKAREIENDSSVGTPFRSSVRASKLFTSKEMSSNTISNQN